MRRYLGCAQKRGKSFGVGLVWIGAVFQEDGDDVSMSGAGGGLRNRRRRRQRRLTRSRVDAIDR